MSDPRATVAGDTITRTLAGFQQACAVHLVDEQAKPLPDNSLIALLADAVRLSRECSSHAAALTAKDARILELEAESNAYEEGLKAAHEGKLRSVNPYPSGDSFHVPPTWQMWDDGYDALAHRQTAKELAAKDAEIAHLKARERDAKQAFLDLMAYVRGECPSLLTSDCVDAYRALASEQAYFSSRQEPPK